MIYWFENAICDEKVFPWSIDPKLLSKNNTKSTFVPESYAHDERKTQEQSNFDLFIAIYNERIPRTAKTKFRTQSILTAPLNSKISCVHRPKISFTAVAFWSLTASKSMPLFLIDLYYYEVVLWSLWRVGDQYIEKTKLICIRYNIIEIVPICGKSTKISV